MIDLVAEADRLAIDVARAYERAVEFGMDVLPLAQSLRAARARQRRLRLARLETASDVFGRVPK